MLHTFNIRPFPIWKILSLKAFLLLCLPAASLFIKEWTPSLLLVSFGWICTLSGASGLWSTLYSAAASNKYLIAAWSILNTIIGLVIIFFPIPEAEVILIFYIGWCACSGTLLLCFLKYLKPDKSAGFFLGSTLLVTAAFTDQLSGSSPHLLLFYLETGLLFTGVFLLFFSFSFKKNFENPANGSR
ncbi:MAG: hypothetical protein MI784_05260 [Cytophagales bacterium]|nr:hypothetical protein [Cytophagales bacterium]